MKIEIDWKEIFSLLAYLAVIGILTFAIIRFVGQRTLVDGSSMEPALSDGDNLIVDKLTYRFREPERFDIIVFPYEEEPEICYIKRVIGLPGETVRIDEDGFIYIDGEKLKESYGREVIKQPGIAAEELTLGQDEYFVLGDNRNDSMDSRDSRVGLIEREEIIGRAVFRIYPLGRMGKIDH